MLSIFIHVGGPFFLASKHWHSFIYYFLFLTFVKLFYFYFSRGCFVEFVFHRSYLSLNINNLHLNLVLKCNFLPLCCYSLPPSPLIVLFRFHLYFKKLNHVLDTVNGKQLGKYWKTVEFSKLYWTHRRKAYSDKTTSKLRFTLLQLLRRVKYRLVSSYWY